MTAQPLNQVEAFSPIDERLCRLLAAGELSQLAIAKQLRIGRVTIFRRLAEPRIQARIAALREEFRTQAMLDAPFADKRARVIARDALAHTLLRQLRDTDLQATIAVTDEGEPILGLDAGRLKLFDQYLNSIAAELDDRAPGTTVGVVVKVYTDPRLGDAGALEAEWHDAPPPNNRPHD